ncbi:MAG: hypothetical protein FWD70_05365, partial [Desulfuromonadales bacterium]|nr:hypothetical protein [Desulfuromonadales bacterium]
MNKIFKTIWNEALCAWVAVAEITKVSKTGRNKSRIVISALALGIYMLLASPVSAATVTWSGGSSSTDWFDAGNWIRTPNSAPVTGDTVYIGTNTAGAATDGSVTIDSGGVAQSGPLYLGYAAGTTGDLTVQSGGSLAASSITLGTLGTGSLNILGGTVSASDTLTVGNRSGSNGGAGSLQITNGGILNSTSSAYNYVCYQCSSPSTVLIDGTGSAWNSYGGLIIGESNTSATSATVTVQNGGLLNMTNTLNSDTNNGLGIADGTGSSGSLIINGPGSTVITTPGITVGIQGTAYLSILDGATLESGQNLYDYDYIGASTSTISTGGIRSEGHVVVDGQGSSWINYTGLMVGYTGIGTLEISNGGSVTSIYDSYIGATCASQGGVYAPNAGHGEVLITGQNSIWTTGTLDMGVMNGADGILTVTDDGTLKTTDPYGIGAGAGGQATINIGAAQGDSAAAPGWLDTSNVALGGQGTLVFNHTSDSYTFTPQISSQQAGTGNVDQLSGTTILTSDSSAFEGSTNVIGGTLQVDGTLGDSVSTVAVAADATLSGVGTIGGNVAIASGGILAPGDAAASGTLTINGDLTLNNGSILNYRFGEANANSANTATGATGGGGTYNDLTVVNGNLTLEGSTLNVTETPGGTFGPGVYRIFNYQGALTGDSSDITLGTMPESSGTYTVQTSVANQVNLIYATANLTFNFWDGDLGPKNNNAVDGGDGTWTADSGNSNWTDSTGS